MNHFVSLLLIWALCLQTIFPSLAYAEGEGEQAALPIEAPEPDRAEVISWMDRQLEAEDQETGDEDVPVPGLEEDDAPLENPFKMGEDGGIPLGTFRAPSNLAEADGTTSLMAAHLMKMAHDRSVDPREMAVVIIHKGERVPAEMRWTIATLKRAGFRVKAYRHRNGNPKNPTAKYAAISQEEMAGKLLWQLKHDAETNPELKKLFDLNQLNDTFIRGLVRRFASRARGFFGLQGGVHWGMYSDSTTGWNRPYHQRVHQMKWSLVVASMVYGISWAASYEKALQNPLLHPGLAALTAACFTVFWGYFELANGAFQGQGKVYNDVAKKVETNSPWFYLSNFFHSFPTSFITQTAFFSIFGMSWATAGHSLANSALGVLGKKPIRMWIVKNLRMGNPNLHDTVNKGHSPTLSFALMLGTTAGLNFLKLGHLFQFSDLVSWTFILLAATGATYEVSRHLMGSKPLPSSFFGMVEFASSGELWSRISKRLAKDARNTLHVLGLRKHVQCDSRVFVRMLTDEEQAAINSGKHGDAGVL